MPMLKILRQFLCAKGGQYGYALSARTDIATGTLYPILDRLEGERWIAWKWEHGTPQYLGRPRRKMYALTALGRRRSTELLADLAV